MKEKMSELMDGELDHKNIDSVFAEFKKNSDLIKDWEAYHMISDALRQPSSFKSFDITDKVREQLIQEPIVFVPRAAKVTNRKFFAISTAASIAILVSSWVLLQPENTHQTTNLVAEKTKEKIVVSHSPSSPPTPALAYPLSPFEYQYFNQQPLARKVFLPTGTMYGPLTSEYQLPEAGNSR